MPSFSGFVVGGSRVRLPGLGEYDRGGHPHQDLSGVDGGDYHHRHLVILSMLAVDLIDLALNPKLEKSR